jgi:hypothetical protein
MKKKPKAKRKAKVLPFWWFDDPETLSALVAQLQTGHKRLEVHIDREQSMTFTVVPLEGVPLPMAEVVLNKSHVCPPWCP